MMVWMSSFGFGGVPMFLADMIRLETSELSAASEIFADIRAICGSFIDEPYFSAGT